MKRGRTSKWGDEVMRPFSFDLNGQVANPFAFFLSTNTQNGMIPLSYVNAE
jgi:hypothetical protein